MAGVASQAAVDEAIDEMNGLGVKGEPELRAVGRLTSWIRKLLGKPSPQVEHRPTHAGPLMSWIKRIFGHRAPPTKSRRRMNSPPCRRSTCLPGQLKLKVGVVSVRGNYREHNEDNFFVPGRRSVRHDSTRESASDMPALTMESSNLFIVADGMGGQQAGEQASLMAVDLIPRAIQRRLPPDEADPARIKEAIRDAVAEVNQEILGSSGAVTEFSNMGTTVVLAQFRFDRVLRRGDRRLAGLPASRRPSGTAHQGSLTGGRPARRRHDHRR